MSLADKLGVVHVGDLLLLEGDPNKVGYVADYNSNTVTLSNTNTIDKQSGKNRNVGRWLRN